MSELARFDPDTGEVLDYDVMPGGPVADARPTWHETGRIRVGVKVPIPGKPGKFRPAKLTRFRLTSADQALIERAAELYGGEPEPWDDAPGAERDGGEQWQVTTLRSALPVRIPPAAAATQAWETWSGGGCERRCDGNWEQLTDTPCVCKAEAEVAIGAGRAFERPCRKTTRISVMLEDLPGAGIWRLETHSTISGDELATWLRIVFPYLPPMAPLVLRVTKTERKRRVPSAKHERGWDWQTFVFPLVSIDTRDQTIGELLASRAIAAPTPVAEVAGRVLEQASEQSGVGGDTPAAQAGSEQPTPDPTSDPRPGAQPGAPGEGFAGSDPKRPPTRTEPEVPPTEADRSQAGGPNQSTTQPGGRETPPSPDATPAPEAPPSPRASGATTSPASSGAKGARPPSDRGRRSSEEESHGAAAGRADPEATDQAEFEAIQAEDDPGKWTR